MTSMIFAWMGRRRLDVPDASRLLSPALLIVEELLDRGLVLGVRGDCP